jgi:hypothetical protein
VTLALVGGTGTLAGILSLHRGATRHAAFGLVATWGLFMLVLSAWLLPAAEPFRTSRRVGEGLAALVRRTGLEPALLNYQEPGLIYAMGRPIAAVGQFGGFSRMMERKEALLTVLTSDELEGYRRKFDVEIDPVEDYQVFSLTKGRRAMLHLAIIRRGEPASLARQPQPDDQGRSRPLRR